MRESFQKGEKVFILLCKGETCGKEGRADRVRLALRQVLREFPAKRVKVSVVHCLGMCGQAPNVLVVSGGTVFHEAAAQDADAIAAEVRGALAGLAG